MESDADNVSTAITSPSSLNQNKIETLETTIPNKNKNSAMISSSTRSLFTRTLLGRKSNADRKSNEELTTVPKKVDDSNDKQWKSIFTDSISFFKRESSKIEESTSMSETERDHTSSASEEKKSTSSTSSGKREKKKKSERSSRYSETQSSHSNCEGYLTKRGHVITNWKARYFVLVDDNLFYYADQKAAHEDGKVVRKVKIDKVAPWDRKPNAFMFFTDQQVPYYVYADGNEEYDKWMNALQSFMPNLEHVDCEGYLTKRGAKFPSYHERYFVLQGTCLKYFSDRASFLAHLPSLGELNITEGQKWDGEKTGIKFKNNKKGEMYVYAENVEDWYKWLSVLEKTFGPPDPVSSSGYLTKQGHKRKSWKKRYFILRGALLSYYEDYEGAHTGGKALSTVTVEEVSTWDGEPFGFVFLTSDQVPYYVYADDERERKKWFHALSTITNGTEKERESEVPCPNCTATLTGSRFCGKCGYRLQSNLPVTDSASTDDILPDDDEFIEDEDNMNELEALSEGARTLLLAVMQTPQELVRRLSSVESLEEKEFVEYDSTSIHEKAGSPVKYAELPPQHARVSNEDNSCSGVLPIGPTKTQSSVSAGNSFKANTTEIETVEDERINSKDAVKENKKRQAEASIEHDVSVENIVGNEKCMENALEKKKEDEEEFHSMVLDTQGIHLSEQEVTGKEGASSATSTAKVKQTPTLYPYLEHDLGFEHHFIPNAESPVRCRLYATLDYASAKHVLVFISDSGPMGLWRQDVDETSAVTRDGPWSMLSYISRAKEEGFGIVLLNPFSNHARVFEEEGKERIVPIPSSSSPRTHVESVWDSILSKCKGDVSLVAYARGGALVKALLSSRLDDATNRLHRVAFIGSKHSYSEDDSHILLELIAQRCINWEVSRSKDIGDQMEEVQKVVGCVCLSAGLVPEHESLDEINQSPILLQRAKESVFAFLTATPEIKGMRGVVRCIRTTMLRNEKTKVPTSSNVLVLGEANRFSSPPQIESELSVKPYMPTKRIPSSIAPPHKGGSGIRVEDFELSKIVGQGGFGRVFLAKKKSQPLAGQYFAMKVLKKQQVLSSGLVKTTMAERKILIEVCHPFVVKLHYAFQSDTKLYLVMDYLSGGSLAYHLRKRRKFPEHWAKFYAAEIALAIAHLHHVNIIYRYVVLPFV